MTDEEKLKSCPTTTLAGWWWKKYFRRYRWQQELMNNGLKWEWTHGGYENFQNLQALYLDNMFLSMFPPLINNNNDHSRTHNRT